MEGHSGWLGFCVIGKSDLKASERSALAVALDLFSLFLFLYLFCL